MSGVSSSKRLGRRIFANPPQIIAQEVDEPQTTAKSKLDDFGLLELEAGTDPIVE